MILDLQDRHGYSGDNAHLFLIPRDANLVDFGKNRVDFSKNLV